MAELRSRMTDDQTGLLMQVRYRNALGDWDSLIDGETGKPLDLLIREDVLQSQSNPQVFMENISLLMQKLARKVSVMETRAW